MRIIRWQMVRHTGKYRPALSSFIIDELSLIFFPIETVGLIPSNYSLCCSCQKFLLPSLQFDELFHELMEPFVLANNNGRRHPAAAQSNKNKKKSSSSIFHNNKTGADQAFIGWMLSVYQKDGVRLVVNPLCRPCCLGSTASLVWVDHCLLLGGFDSAPLRSADLWLLVECFLFPAGPVRPWRPFCFC